MVRIVVIIKEKFRYGKTRKGIYKRYDGRYEGRFIKGRDMNGKAVYGYVTARICADVKMKLDKAKLALESEKVVVSVETLCGMLSAHIEGGAKTVVSTFDPKSKVSIRSIPLQKFILDMLAEHKKKSVGVYVLSGSDKPVEPRVYQRRFNKLLKSAGIREVNFHTLRHNFAVRALEKGVDYKTISELLGHGSPVITMKTYAHSLNEHKRNSMEVLAHLYE